MRLVTFDAKGRGPLPGVLREDGHVVDLVASMPSLPVSIREILAAGLLEEVRTVSSSSDAVILVNAVFRTPIPDPGKIICIGLNYRDHAIESGMAIPTEPIVFSKFSSALIGPDEPIRLPSISDEVDYEAELVVVMGREAKNVTEADALAFVAGVTNGNDISARDWQLRKPGGQWLLGKNFDTFAAVGPTIATLDELSLAAGLPIRMRLNGVAMQDSTTRQLIFGIEQLIAYLSQIFVLEPGDLIFTGTPPGVGMGRKPPTYLKPGDVCEVEIEGVGILRNPCVRAQSAKVPDAVM
jgi:2-keto-4-pentenoate hydratase/2-oxohepta-3-ene-1,7-dioic acid hydratase in catechol pathway